MQYMHYKKTRFRNALAGALIIASFAVTGTAQAQSFPPFPEPAVGPFPDTENMRLLSQMLPAEIGAVTPRFGVLLNDIWGWTSPNGEEYALIGTSDGMSIVRVTNPKKPEFIGIMPTSDPGDFANLWGDVGVYNVHPGRDDDDDDDRADQRHDDDDDDDDDRADLRHDDDDDDDDHDSDWYTGYAYFVTEADGVELNILELNQLDYFGPATDPNFQIPPSASFSGGGYDSAHNIYVHQETGYAYVMGVGLIDDGPTACDDHEYHPSRFNTMILDLNEDPLDPKVVACLADFGEHDAYVVNYWGPDRDYHGREIAFIFDGREKDAPSRRGMREDDTPGELVGGTTEIWDVTDKDDIRVISSFTVPGICFSHQGWTSSNRHEFLLINDELDELRDADEIGIRSSFCDTDKPPGTVTNAGIYVMNIRDLDNPVFQERFEIDAPGEIDHNFVRKGNKLYWAVYNAGTRVLELKHSRKGRDLKLKEIGRLDSEPRPADIFFGQWGIFPFPDSKTIVASDINNGLMIMRLDKDKKKKDDDDRFSLTSTGTPTAAGTPTLAAPASLAARRTATRNALVEHYKLRIR